MLEVKDLIKVYKGKNGNDVRAIDGVSLTFAEKGMIFLLGKSGSGKSTLLNLCGGLDFPDSGEIIIKGRSSKDFSQADFDSYRNTFVGFVFQEYNILDEFSVESNIALALELQGRSKDRQAVKDILEKVELTDFAKRKPNTLSGGQKQRVAIARALVKNPEIILADEPTGALDSATGKQVLDTLKKLSEEKLVIVVSHDREFAEQYADRIIELKDGKVISDVTKEKVAAKQASENVSFIGDDTVSVKDGSALTDEDMSAIRAFLSKKGGRAVIAGGQKAVGEYEKIARIDKDGAQEQFRDTTDGDAPKKEYSGEESKLIRSRLPLRHAVKIGASGLKVKPFRLFFTVLLSVVAFVMFGLLSVLLFFDPIELASDTYAQSGYDYIVINKHYSYISTHYKFGVETYSGESDDGTDFTPADLAEAREKYGAAYGAFTYSTDDGYPNNLFTITDLDLALTTEYYRPYVTMFIETDGETQDFELLTDTDLGALGESDVVIPSYLFDALVHFGFTNGSKPLETYDDVTGATLDLNCRNMHDDVLTVTVKGVYRLDPPEKYSTIKDGSEPKNSSLFQLFDQEMENGLYAGVLVSPDFYYSHLFLAGGDYMRPYVVSGADLNLNVESADAGSASMSLRTFAPLSAYPYFDDNFFYIDKDADGLSENGIMVSFSYFCSSYSFGLLYKVSLIAEAAIDEAFRTGLAPYVEQYKEENAAICNEFYASRYDSAKAEGASDQEAAEKAQAALLEYIENRIQVENPVVYEEVYSQSVHASRPIYTAFNNNRSILTEGVKETEEGVTVPATKEDVDAAIAYFFDVLGLAEVSDYTVTVTNELGLTVLDDVRIEGFYYGANANDLHSACVYFSDAVYQKMYDSFVAPFEETEDVNGEDYYKKETKYVRPADAIYEYIVTPYNEGAAFEALIAGERQVNGDDDTFYTVFSPLSTRLYNAAESLDIMEQVFLWSGLVMAVFAMLLLFNFISASIADKKKEIGILRAVGAKSSDVFVIFFVESLIIALICFALATALCFAICPWLNSQVAAIVGLDIMSVGPLSILVMFAIAIVTSLIATFLPVYAIAKKRPVDSIRSL